MAQALRDIGCGGIIYAYDLWENYEYGHGQTIKKVKNNLKKYFVDKLVTLKYGDLHTWLDNESNFEQTDLIHVDINNDGSIIQKLKNKNLSCNVLFEGGIIERDNCWWMTEFNKTPMTTIKQIVNYKVLNKNYPGISLIEGDKK